MYNNQGVQLFEKGDSVRIIFHGERGRKNRLEYKNEGKVFTVLEVCSGDMVEVLIEQGIIDKYLMSRIEVCNSFKDIKSGDRIEVSDKTIKKVVKVDKNFFTDVEGREYSIYDGKLKEDAESLILLLGYILILSLY